MSRLWLTAVLVCAAVPLSATTLLFTPGNLIWAAQDGRVYEISTAGTAPQNFTGVQPIADLGGFQIGQLAFSLDAQTAYATLFDSNKVVAISNTGHVSDFATGINGATGLIRTSTGQLLVASYTDGKIYDITSGTASVYAWGLGNPRNMVETAAGIYVADQGSSAVRRVTQGDLAAAPALATNIEAVAIASFNNRLYVTSSNLLSVYDVTAGGSTWTTAVAKNKNFTSLAAANGHLYAGTNSTVSATSGIWEIPKSGQSYTTANALAYNLALSGDSLLSVVPNPVAVITPPPVLPASVPEPGTAIAGFALISIGISLSRRSGK